MSGDHGEITRLLQEWRSGDSGAESRLFELLLPDLHRIALRHFGKERAGHTLQPSALVNEAFLRLVKAKDVDWQDRGHFFAIAGRVMRRFLIDHARGRPGVELLPLDSIPGRIVAGKSPTDLATAVDDVLKDLERENPERCRVVELKFFLGLTDQEAADALGLSLHTLQREWYRARRWLFERLDPEQCQTHNATSA